MNIELNEALKNLQEHGFEVELDEGKLGRILSIGALAIGSLFGHSKAEIDNLDLRTSTIEEIKEIKTTFEQEDDIDYCKIRGKGLVCKYKDNSIAVYPIDKMNLETLNNDVTEIIFLDPKTNKNKIGGVIFNTKHGSKTTITYKNKAMSGEIAEFDEFDKEISKSQATIDNIKEIVDDIYKDVMKEIQTSDSDFERQIIQKYSNPNSSKTTIKKTTQAFSDDSLTASDNTKLNDIMAKYVK